MSVPFMFSTIFEILMVTAVIWAIFHEDRLITFEKNLVASIKRRRLKVLKKSTVHYSNHIYDCSLSER